MGLLLPADDVVGIVERVQLGDPTAGWRGDPTMDVYVDHRSGEARVMGFDAEGNRYKVAQVRMLPGWQHALLKKLREGDWRDPELIDRQMAEMAATDTARQAVIDERMDEHAERLAWALRRDAGTHYGGLTREFY